MPRSPVIILLILLFPVLLMAERTNIAIIPEPVGLKVGQGEFLLTDDTEVVCCKANRENAELFAEMIRPAMGFDLPVREGQRPRKGAINLLLNEDLEAVLGTEGYNLKVTTDGIDIEAAGTAGAFYALQTLRQLLPPQIYGQTRASVKWAVPCVEVEDYPRFKWRGMHMDVARHFMPKEFVKKFIDTLAMHKMNNLHWHLTEDQGWRIEIKKYPKLTELGSVREQTIIHPDLRTPGGPKYDGTPHGGFYSQEDIREIVEYARKRHVNIMPEIEMPGHSQAALTAYPEFGCTGEKLKLKCEPGVSPHLYNIDEKTFTFLQDILTEVMELFPGKYIHIGGDEAPKGQWKSSPEAQAKIKELGLENEEELQSWFIDRMGEFLRENGRQLVGWQEIMHGGTPEGAVVMPWMSLQSGIDAANAGHDIVVATTYPFYFDSKQTSAPNEPIALMNGPFTMDWAYNFNMSLPQVDTDKQKHVLGVQGQLWSEYMPTPAVMEYQAFPRAIAVAELGWSPKAKKDYNHFYKRLFPHAKRLDALEINYRYLDPLPVAEWNPETIGKDSSFKVDVTDQVTSAGNYGVRLQYSKGGNGLEVSEVALLENGRKVAVDRHRGFTGNEHRRNIYKFKLPEYDLNKKYALEITAGGGGGSDSYGEITLLSGKSLDAYHLRHYPLGAVPIGYWDFPGRRKGDSIVELDLSGLIKDDGEYDLELRSTDGDGAAVLSKAGLYQDGKAIYASAKPLTCDGKDVAARRLDVSGLDANATQLLKLKLTGSDTAGEIYLIKIRSLARQGDHGIWTPKDVVKTFVPVELDIADLITQSGKYQVTFKYTGGGHGLDIEGVALYCDGEKVDEDNHAGFAGGRSKDHLYTLEIQKYNRAADYRIKATIKGSGGNDTHGIIKIEQL